MFKVNNRTIRTRCEICSKLTIKTRTSAIRIVMSIVVIVMYECQKDSNVDASDSNVQMP